MILSHHEIKKESVVEKKHEQVLQLPQLIGKSLC